MDIRSNTVVIRSPDTKVTKEEVAFISIQLAHGEKDNELGTLLISEGLLRYLPEEMP